MSTIKINGFLYVRKTEWQREIEFSILSFQSRDPDVWGACLGPVSFDWEMPEGLRIEDEMVRAQIEELERQKNEATRRFAETVANINDRMSKLRALTNEAPNEVPA